MLPANFGSLSILCLLPFKLTIFQQLVDETIDDIREKFDANEVQTVSVRIQSSLVQPPQHQHSFVALSVAQEQFIASKTKEQISSTSVQQLLQRTKHFIAAVEVIHVCEITSDHAL